jgi:hypothetical protein
MFQVIWLSRAEQRLAAVWLASANRNAVTDAAYQIDLVLDMFPNSAGEGLFDSIREYSYGPLGVEFEVDTVGRRVTS